MAEHRDATTDALRALRLGDVIAVPGGRRAGPAVVLDPGVAWECGPTRRGLATALMRAQLDAVPRETSRPPAYGSGGAARAFGAFHVKPDELCTSGSASAGHSAPPSLLSYLSGPGVRTGNPSQPDTGSRFHVKHPAHPDARVCGAGPGAPAQLHLKPDGL
jgi:hypothetical protein